MNQLLGSHLSHSWAARDVVGSIALQCQQVDDLQRTGEAIFCFYLLNTLNLHFAALAAWVINLHLVGHELPKVFVGRHHVSLKAMFLSHVGKGAYHVVGLITGHLNHGDVVGLDDALDVRYCTFDVLGGLVAVGFIVFVGLMPEGPAWGVEAHSNVGGLLFLENILKGVDKPKDCRRVESARREPRVAHQRIVSPEYERISVKKKKLHNFLSVKGKVLSVKLRLRRGNRGRGEREEGRGEREEGRGLSTARLFDSHPRSSILDLRSSIPHPRNQKTFLSSPVNDWKRALARLDAPMRK